MLSLSITDGSVKPFMNRLLRGNIFDAFETRSAELIIRTRISVSGASEDENGGFVKWGELKPIITEIIKTGGRPRFLKIVFSADSGITASVHENAQALFLNIIYENNGVYFTTATSQKLFNLDKTLDAEWDGYMLKFFKQNNIDTAERVQNPRTEY